MSNNLSYNAKHAVPNKLLQEDGTITTLSGTPVTFADTAYKNKPALPNKFLNPDGSYSTLNEILAEVVDTDLFIIVEELPETGESNKIYMLVQDDKLIEYVWVNNKWDPIGMIEFDINNYYNKSQVTSLIASAVSAAEAYTDGKISATVVNMKSYADEAASSAQTNAVSSSNSYTDTQIQEKITQVLEDSY